MRTTSKSKHTQRSPKKGLVMNSGEAEGRNPLGTPAEKMDFTGISSEERHQLIAQAAYFRAEQRHFAPGHELEDWLRAETEIKTRFLEFSAADPQKHT